MLSLLICVHAGNEISQRKITHDLFRFLIFAVKGTIESSGSSVLQIMTSVLKELLNFAEQLNYKKTEVNMQSKGRYICKFFTRAKLQEKEGLAGDLRSAFVGSKSLYNGYQLQFSLTPDFFEKVGRFISLQRKCCEFINFRVDVPAPKLGKDDVMFISLTGGRGAKSAFKPLLTTMGLKKVSTKNLWSSLGVFGLAFSILCCILPFVFLGIGMASAASFFVSFEPIAMFVMETLIKSQILA